jgi:peptidoglycan/LPS O-acetylase OafA/YrhL
MEDWRDSGWHRPTDDVSWMIVGIHVYWWSGSVEIQLYILFFLLLRLSAGHFNCILSCIGRYAKCD